MQIFIIYFKRLSHSATRRVISFKKRLKPVAPIKRHFVLLGKFSFYNHSGVLNLCANLTRHFIIFSNWFDEIIRPRIQSPSYGIVHQLFPIEAVFISIVIM
jgi:hypothetical protein